MVLRRWFSSSARRDRRPGFPELPRRRVLQLAELEDRVLYSVAPVPGADAGPDANAEQPVVDLQTLVGQGIDPGLLGAEADPVNDAGDVPAGDASLDAHEDDAPKLVDTVPEQDRSDVRHELVFVDSQIERHSELMDALRENSDPRRVIDIVVLDADRDGIEQITETLAARHDVDAVHVLSHGAEGALKLGGTWLHEGNLGA